MISDVASVITLSLARIRNGAHVMSLSVKMLTTIIACFVWKHQRYPSLPVLPAVLPDFSPPCAVPPVSYCFGW